MVLLVSGSPNLLKAKRAAGPWKVGCVDFHIFAQENGSGGEQPLFSVKDHPQ